MIPKLEAEFLTAAEPPKPFATPGEAYGVGTWRKGGEWRANVTMTLSLLLSP
jgi:hypothetical protein